MTFIVQVTLTFPLAPLRRHPSFNEDKFLRLVGRRFDEAARKRAGLDQDFIEHVRGAKPGYGERDK